MKKKWMLLFGFAILLVGGGIFTVSKLKSPINPPLVLMDNPSSVILISNEDAAQPGSPNKSASVCGNSGMMRIMEIAAVPSTEASLPISIAIYLIAVDFSGSRIGMLNLPSYFWVSTPDELVADLGIQAPMNEIYFAAYQEASADSDQDRFQKATQVLAQTILDEFGFMPDKYIHLNGESFVNLVDTLGGIDITLDQTIDASNQNFGVFQEGLLTLDGQQSLNFLRIYGKTGHFGQMQRQNMVISAVIDATLKPENWKKAPKLFMDTREMMVTDLSVSQGRDLACMLGEARGNTEVLVVDWDMTPADEQGRKIPDVGMIRELIGKLEDR